LPAASPIANDNRAIDAMLRMRGLCLARVSKRDLAANERALSGYRQYIKDHPEDARRYGIRQPHELSEDQLVFVAVENNQPTVYLFNQVITATELVQLKQYISSLNPSMLPDVEGAAGELRTASETPPAVEAKPQAAAVPETSLTVGAIARRWGYSRQGVQKLAQRPDFPPPCFTFKRGRIRIWAVEDIEQYERDRPELHSQAAKILKVRGFARAIQKGRKQNAG